MAGVWCGGQRERRRGRQNQGRTLPAPRATSANTKVRTRLHLQDGLPGLRTAGTQNRCLWGDRERGQERATEASLKGP